MQDCHPIVSTLSDFANYIVKFNEILYYDDDTDHNDADEQTSDEIERKIPLIETLVNAYQQLPVSRSYGIFTGKFHTQQLLSEIKEFTSQIPVDYHPGMNNKVRDIVHPSLYPLILEQTDEKQEKKDFWDRPYEDSKYQWLPSEFFVDQHGKCSIKSHINNLPISQKSLYQLIENAFNSVLYKFEECWTYTNYVSLLVDDEYVGTQKPLQNLELRNRNLQVITKIVEISLSGEPLLGSWHVEGMSHENIVATATITLEQTEHFKAELLFKRIYSKSEAEEMTMNTHQGTPEELKEIYRKLHIPLGKHEISCGDVLVFPNSHIHKIDMSGSGSRTILVFWLINPNIRIKSTADIAQQTYPIEQAHEHRLALMKERTVYKSTFNQRELNLCEH